MTRFLPLALLAVLSGCINPYEACEGPFAVVFAGFAGTAGSGSNVRHQEWHAVVAGRFPELDGYAALAGTLFNGSGGTGSLRFGGSLDLFRLVLPVPLMAGDSFDVVPLPTDGSIRDDDGFSPSPRPQVAYIRFGQPNAQTIDGRGSVVVTSSKGGSIRLRLRALSLPGSAVPAVADGDVRLWAGEYPERCYGT